MDTEKVQDTEKKQTAVPDATKDVEQETEENSGDGIQWNEQQQAYLKKLRDENAKYRTKAKETEGNMKALSEKLSKFEKGLKTLVGGEDEQVSPEEQLEQVKAINENIILENSLKDMALEHGLNQQAYKYFKYLMGDKFQSLEDGEEITEEDIAQFVAEAKRVGGQQAAKTSVGKGDKDPSPNQDDEVSLEDFKAMSVVQKSILYDKNKALYDKLFAMSMKKKI